jgi:hypothetical protein
MYLRRETDLDWTELKRYIKKYLHSSECRHKDKGITYSLKKVCVIRFFLAVVQCTVHMCHPKNIYISVQLYVHTVRTKFIKLYFRCTSIDVGNCL